mmetsp:Transcript_36501/g.104303  ORF Transcript_36501/g.104303 Transcript_36501/m.104303 type:complete len:227 (+) Transcript_36501:107-787(+)
MPRTPPSSVDTPQRWQRYSSSSRPMSTSPLRRPTLARSSGSRYSRAICSFACWSKPSVWITVSLSLSTWLSLASSLKEKTKSARLRSRGMPSKYLSVKVLFCEWSVRCVSTPTISSPRGVSLTLSSSSKNITGFMHCASMIRPAILPQVLPTYVYEWPSSTEASVAPPRLICTKGRSRASAMPFLHSVVFPLPGGPWMPRTRDMLCGLAIHWQRSCTIFCFGSSCP